MTLDRLRTIRARQSAIRDLVPDLGSDPVTNVPAFVGSVFAISTVPLSTGVYFAVHPVAVTGNEGEGRPGSLSVDSTRTVLVFVLGPQSPRAGENLICRFVGNRWIAERMKAAKPASISIPGCPCVGIPSTLHMVSSKPTSNSGIFQSSSLVYGPTPPAYSSLGLGASCFLSPSSFTDKTSGDPFQYYLGCNAGYYTLSRVYTTSTLGSPYIDSIRYKWLIGVPGNTCIPFIMAHGQMFVGGDTSCVVNITQ